MKRSSIIYLGRGSDNSFSYSFFGVCVCVHDYDFNNQHECTLVGYMGNELALLLPSKKISDSCMQKKKKST